MFGLNPSYGTLMRDNDARKCPEERRKGCSERRLVTFACQAHMIETARRLFPAGEEMLELGSRGLPRWFDGGEPRWFVPAGGWRVRRGGSSIYPAFRRRARAYRAALRAWISLGGARFTHHTSVSGKGEWPLAELLLPDMPALSTAAVSIGIPGPGQKITLRLMDDRGRVLGFAKYADRPYPRSLLANEAWLLERLPPNVGPQLVRFSPFLEGDLLVQTPLPGRPRTPKPRLDGPQIDFFERLVQPTQTYTVYEHPFVRDLYSRAGERKDMFEAVVEGFAESEWPLSWLHGDMAPWNLHWRRGVCLAFDWEHGSQRGFPYLDAAATLIQVASIIQRAEPPQAKREVSEGIKPCLPARYEGLAPAIASLSALNMLVSWYPPRPPDDYEVWLKEFVESPGG